MHDSQIFNRYYNLTLRYLSYRPRSRKEILEYLKGKKISEEIITKIIKKLEEYKFIDDKEFAKFWIEQRTKYKNKPIRVIGYELSQKGIEKSLIEESLEKLKDNDSDLESAKKLAAKKLDFHRNIEPKKRKEKVTGYLLRKGFSYDIVKKVLKD